jgi:secondary thiamine-phosphate synthase enzyme
MVLQSSITLPPKARGVYLITNLIENEIKIDKGIVNIFLQHTSCSLAINENYDSSVRVDVESFLNSLIPDGWRGFTHTLEGEDDMPAHMKNIFIGSSLIVPVKDKNLALGTWQGIYFLEHRNYPTNRKILITQIGE